MRLSLGMAREAQQIAFLGKAALPTVVTFGLTSDQHFEETVEVAQQPLLLENVVLADEDLHFVASVMCTQRAQLVRLRQMALQALKQLKRR